MAKLPPDRDTAPDQTLNPMEREPVMETGPLEGKGRKEPDDWQEYLKSLEEFPPEWVDG